MPGLPIATTATSSSATEADVKNYLTALRDYLNGLLGSSGSPADARVALGVADISAQQIQSALGFMPANSAHSHAYAPMTAFVACRYVHQTADNTWNYLLFTLANGATYQANTTYNAPGSPSGGE